MSCLHKSKRAHKSFLVLTSYNKGDSAYVLFWSFNSNLVLNLLDVLLFYFGKVKRPYNGIFP